MTTLLLSLVFFAPHPAPAAILFLKGSDEPLYVLTIREDETKFVVGVPQGGGRFDERIYEKRNVDQLIRTVSAERLAELAPEKPSAYRDYAEELAAKRADPDAVQGAIRLYLMAAYLDRDNLGRSSLLGMTALARSPEEERKFRAMAYLLDPKHDRSVLVKRTSAPAEVAADEAEQRDALVTALRTLRQGDRRVAERIAERPTVEAAFAKFGRSFTHEEFLSACRSAEPLPPSTLARIIYLELELTGGGREAAADDVKAGPKWAAAIAARDTQPVPSLSLETLTEFDPRRCLFRDGQWVAP